MMVQILAVLYVAGILGFAIPMTKFYYTHNHDETTSRQLYGYSEERLKKERIHDFWTSFLFTLLTIWFWPIIVPGFYVKQFVLPEDK